MPIRVPRYSLPGAQKMDVFLSYAHEDRPRAKELAQAIAERGWTVWWDKRIRPGDSFSRVIQRNLDVSKCVLVLWSTHSVESEWVEVEASDAKGRGKLIPVLIDDVAASIPLEFRRMQAVVLAPWPPEEGNMSELFEAIGAKILAPHPRQKRDSRRSTRSAGLRERPRPRRGLLVLSVLVLWAAAGAQAYVPEGIGSPNLDRWAEYTDYVMFGWFGAVLIEFALFGAARGRRFTAFVVLAAACFCAVVFAKFHLVDLTEWLRDTPEEFHWQKYRRVYRQAEPSFIAVFIATGVSLIGILRRK